MAKEFVTRRRVAFAETDMAGIVHFANYFRYMEDAEHELWRSTGISVVHRREDGSLLTWPRVHASCNYRKPIRFEDEVEIGVRVSRSGSKALRFRFSFRLAGEEVAEGVLVAVCCLFRDGHLEAVPIPDEVLNRLTPYLEPADATPPDEAGA